MGLCLKTTELWIEKSTISPFNLWHRKGYRKTLAQLVSYTDWKMESVINLYDAKKLKMAPRISLWAPSYCLTLYLLDQKKRLRLTQIVGNLILSFKS